MDHFYKRLKFYRERKGLKVKEMALLLNTSQSTYRDWEYGRSITGEPYMAMAKVLEVSLEELLNGHKTTPDTLQKRLENIQIELNELSKELNSFF
jgi:transcriptional regulator with XRE-family HTH domain